MNVSAVVLVIGACLCHRPIPQAALLRGAAFAATIPTLGFTPGVHINHAETVQPMRDSLPKLKDFPA